MITNFDDYCIHQTAQPVAQPSQSDRNFYDRYWFNGMDEAGTYIFEIGLGLYPNRRIMDGHFSVATGGKQYAFHGSRRAPKERGETQVGPLSIEIVTPMRQVRVVLAPNEHNIGLRFEISFPSEISGEPLTGRMFLTIARNNEPEPRLQVGRYGVPVYGVDFEDLAPDTPVIIDADTLGWPIETLSDFPPGDYHVQAVLNMYTRFERADGHVVWMHNDQWEGQNWRRSPGNVVSAVQQIRIDPARAETHRIEVTEVIPPIQPPEDTAQVKRIRMKSDILTE